MTTEPTMGPPGDQGGQNSGLQAAIDRWHAVNQRANSPRPFSWVKRRTIVWMVVAVVGLLAAAVLFPTVLNRAGQPVLIHNPYVHR